MAPHILTSQQQTWRASVPLSAERAATQASACIDALNTLLDDESNRAAPYPCLLYVASTQIYIIASKLALSHEDSRLSIASTRFYNILINGEAEGVLDSKIFARSLIDLVRKVTARSRPASTEGSSTGLSDEEEGNLVELLFLVATKIRSDPDILPAWFYPERDENHNDSAPAVAASFVGATRKNAFPLFYLLVNYVHHDGRMGDFARTGLLYLTETASTSKILEKWMIESDLATTMASGLGALYSRLTRRLPYIDRHEKLPAILTLSDYEPPPSPVGFSFSDYQHNLDAFLSYLMFWQDTLDHCASSEVTETLLDHFQVLFLQQLLYPSLLESSDVEGGSTASVITYLYRILAALTHPAMVQRILQYLLASADQSKPKPSKHRPRMSLSRRKSMNQLAVLAEAQENPSPTLFNLLDLIVMNLKSKHPQTIIATFKLLSVILQKHHSFVKTSLFSTRPFQHWIPRWTMPMLNQQLATLFVYASDVGKDSFINESYEKVLSDVTTMLGSHSCSLQLLKNGTDDFASKQQQVRLLACPLKTEMSELLHTFFTNETMTNLALTESIISLACCKLVSLDGWLISMMGNNEASSEHSPDVCSIIEILIDQVRQWRSSTSDWDALLASQKQKLTSDDEPYTDDVKASSGQSDRIPVQANPRDRRGRSLRSEVFGSMENSLTASPSPRPSASRITPASPVLGAFDGRNGEVGSMRISPALDAPQQYLTVPQQLPNRNAGVTEQMRMNAIPKDLYGADDFSSGAVTPSEQEHETGDASASLGHILTNAVILQEFILEIIAVIQVRASFLDEMNFE